MTYGTIITLWGCISWDMRWHHQALTIIFPTFPPCNIPINACGRFSNPFTIVSSFWIWPLSNIVFILSSPSCHKPRCSHLWHNTWRRGNLSQFSPPDEEPLHLKLEGHHCGLEGGEQAGAGVVVAGDGAADRDPAVHVHVHQHSVGDEAPNIVKITVNTAGSGSPQSSLNWIEHISKLDYYKIHQLQHIKGRRAMY